MGSSECAPPLHPRPLGIGDWGSEAWPGGGALKGGCGPLQPPPPLPAALSHRFPSCSEELF